MLALAAVALGTAIFPGHASAEDAPPAPAPAPAPDAEREAALRRATELDEQAARLSGQGKHAEATPPARESLAIRERVVGSDHPDVAASLNSLAELLRAQGAYTEAGPLHERALSIRERAFGKDHPAVAQSLNNLASLRRAQGRFAEARPLYERALAMYEGALGRDHTSVASSLNNLAVLLMEQGAFAEARPLCERALAIYEKALGQDHPTVASCLTNLAGLLKALGARGEARPRYERALGIYERALGKDHPDVANALNNLAMLLHSQGAYSEARPLHERALAIWEKALGPEHPRVALSLNNLAGLLEAQGAYAEALPLYERALAIESKSLGNDHPTIARTLNNIAFTLQAQGVTAEARRLYERALGIYEKSLGPDHPLVATSLNNLAVLLREQGSYAEARLLHERALAIREKALGPDHPDVGRSLNNLAALLQAQGHVAEARPLYDRALALGEARVRAELSALGAAQRLSLVRSVRYLLDNWLRFTRQAGLSGHAEALRLRGIVSRAEAAERALVRRATGEQRATLASLQAATRLAARLANTPPGKPEARAAWQDRYAQAAAERERLTRLLSAQVASARTALERLDLTAADIQNTLAADAALVDLLRAGDSYVAWVLRASGEALRVELGAADAIEAACEALVTAITTDADDEPSRQAVAQAGADLRALVWAPIEAQIGGGVRRVVLCPDAALASVSFAALPGTVPGTFLGDELALSFVSHPFDLVPRPAVEHGTGAFVMGGVDYDRAETGSKEAPPLQRPAVFAALDQAPHGRTFPPLAATRTEAEGLRARFGADATTLLLGAEATEARMREGVKGKRFVHVATHGFARTDLLAGLRSRKIAEAFLSADAERQLSVGHDPMLLSGLALAGANPRDGAGGDDGILTALEASYLDLDGVDLVALSACETALGTAESGEGVLGLVSAFQMAGARHVLASLWSVDDEATRLLMDGVYERMLRKQDPLAPADALREAARALRSWKDPATGKARFAAPRYWAAFVAYGG